MNDEFTRRVRHAAIAGWWTLLIGAIFLATNWLAYLVIIGTRPDWMLRFWGGGEITWATIQNIWVWIVGVFKMCVWVLALVVIWLSLWARRLKRAA